MKLSWKFFFLAYIMVLLSAGIGGLLLVRSTTDTLWQERIDRCKYSHTYAVNSFYSMSDTVILGGTEATGLQNNIEYQIQRTLDSSVSKLEIKPLYANNEDEYADLQEGVCVLSFNDEGSKTVMKISTKVKLNDESYAVSCESDFTSLKEYNRSIWMQYRITIVAVSVLCGALLFVFAKRLTKPLGKITAAVSKVSEGNYGYSIDVKGGGAEVQTLAENFNRMSVVVKDSLEKVEDECRRRDTFIADFTHEIKTPVTSIIGYADMLCGYELSEEEKSQAAQAVYREGRRLERLSMQLLQLIVTENEMPNLEPVSLCYIETRLKDTLRFLSGKYSITASVDFASCTVLANEALLLSLVYNLADNAFKASKPKSQVNIYSSFVESGVKITVEDKGHGIAKEHINLITEPFYREDKSRSRKSGGAGIGLALCKEICALHSTELEIESEKDKGTRVSFVLSVYNEEAGCEE